MAEKQFYEYGIEETKDLVIVCTQCGKEILRKDGISKQEYEETDTLAYQCPNGPYNILKKMDMKWWVPNLRMFPTI